MLSQRLVWKYVVVFGVVYGLFSLICMSLATRWQRDHLLGTARVTLHELAQAVSDDLEPQHDAERLRAQVASAGARSGTRIHVLDQQGGILAGSSDPVGATFSRDWRTEIAAAAEHGESLVLPSNLLGEAPFIRYTRRVEMAEGGTRFVQLEMPWEEQEQWLRSFRSRLLMLFSGGGVALILTAVALTAPVAEQARQIALSAQQISDGDFSGVVRVQGSDEMALLSRSFDEMRSELALHVDRLKKNSERLAIVLGTMSEGVVAIDNRKQVLFANSAARAMLEFVTPEAVGRPLLEAVRNRSVHELLDVAFTSELPRTTELELGTAVRRLVDVHTRRLPGSPSPGVLMVLHDVSDLRRLENLRQEFVANVSHELKTPLTIIKAFAETLLEGAINDTEHNVSFVIQISEQAERLHQLILDLLTVARIESGDERFEFAALPLAKLIDACVQRYSAAADAKSVVLSGDPAVDGLQVFADEEGMREILDNLVDNAIKYTPQGGSVTIQCRAEPTMVTIEVCDTGIGIPPDQQGRIFERFYRVDKARSRELGGTGLGLSIVKHLVAAMGGSVAVKSGPNQGSTFTVRLPRA